MISTCRIYWTVDEPEDFELVRLIFENLCFLKRDFLMRDVLELLDKNPNYEKINRSFVRNEGYQKSLLEDARLINTIKADDNNGKR